MTSLLDVETLSGGYGGPPVLHDVSFDLRQGELVGLLGPNGAGKTTLLSAVSGTLTKTSGSVRLHGHRLDGKPAWHRVRDGMSLVPEGRRVFTTMTVEDNLRSASPTAPRRTDLSFVYDLFPRLQERRGQLAGTMSGGEQQMLAIGRALVAQPRVLLVDEMSQGLAPVIVDDLVAALVRLRDGGLSVLVIEQNPRYVAGAADRILLMARGELVATGTFDELGGLDAIANTYLGARL